MVETPVNFTLAGPFPLPLDTVQTAARDALRAVADVLRAGERPPVADGSTPGLHLLLTDEESPKIAGFWLVFGEMWVESGPVGPPDTVPPFVGALLEGAV